MTIELPNKYYEGDNENMKLSIVTVTFNCQDLVRKTIISVLEQVYQEVEYIIVDGKSTDKTYEIITEYSGRDKRIKCVSDYDTGIYNAMNKALNYVTGEYVLFLNAGDYLYSKNTLAHFADKIVETHYPDIINGNTIVYTNFGIDKIERKPFNKKLFVMANTICHQSVLARTELFKEYQFDELFQYCADRDWLYYMYFKGKKFIYMNEDVVYYDGTGYSSNRKAKKVIVEERFMIQKKYCKQYFYIHKFIRKVSGFLVKG